MRTSTAYFAGAGTVMAAIAAGLGGGLLMGNIVSSKSPPQEMTRLEQRMASQRSQSAPSAEPMQPPAAGTIVAANPPQASTPPQADVQTALPPKSEATSVTVTPPPAQAPAATPVTAAVTPILPAPAPEVVPVQPEAKKQTAKATEDSITKPRDAEPRRAERRRERSQQWTERRRQRQDQELQEVEQAVREETGPRRAFAVEPVRSEMPLIKLFGSD